MRGCAIFSAVLIVLTVSGTTARAQTPGRSADGLWQTAGREPRTAALRRTDIVGPHTILQLDRAALDARLAQAPSEAAQNRPAAPPVVVSLPLPDGRFSRFRIDESPILAPELAAAFPQFKTYRGTGIDDPTATARLDVTGDGLHAQILAAGGTVYVDPYAAGDLVNHVSYDKASRARTGERAADVVDGASDSGLAPRSYNELPMTNGTVLRTYRLALAATGEYTAAAGGTKAAALSRITTSMNRVNGIYERELAVRMTVATGTPADPTLLIYTNAATDPYDNSSATTMLGQNQTNLDTLVGSANYDIGHVFSTFGGGVATLRSVCGGGIKARGVTGLPSPTGQVFDVDYVSHEMGHQFGANHSYNSSSGSCGANRSGAHAYEIGSGVSIMGYTGLCAPENTVVNSVDVFTIDSLNEATAFVTSGSGQYCGAVVANGNLVPAVTAPASVTVPANTPFELTATAADGNGDALTYSWEQFNRNALTTANPWSADDGVSPLFRSYAPSTSPTRTFPSLTYILNNSNAPPASVACQGGGSGCISGEVLPTTPRTMNFQVIVRDNRAGGSAIATAQTLVTVDAASGPFTVTAPGAAAAWPAFSTQTITWAVNGTHTLAPNVTILLSTDGGLTFPVTLLGSTPNDGSADIVVPPVPTSQARIKVKAAGGVFFDIAGVNVTIAPPMSPPGVPGKSTPANGQSSVSRHAVLSWTAAADTERYEYCLDTSANAACDTAWVSTGTGASLALSGLAPGTGYSWQVRAVNAAGQTIADGGGWWTFTTQSLANPQAEIALDFGTGVGLWTYSGGGTPTWSQLHGLSPAAMTTGELDANGLADLVVTFPGAGVWAYMNNSTWAQLHPLDATRLAAGDLDGNGIEDLVANFPGYGIWARFDSGSWVQLNALNSTVLAVGNTDGTPGGRADLAVAFAGQGTWVLRNNSHWVQLHPQTALQLQVGDVDGSGVLDLIVQFGGLGQYILYNGTSWALLHPTLATAMVIGNIDGDAGHRSDIVLNFPGLGVWTYMNNGTWSQLHGLNASVLATGDVDGNGQSDVILVFPGIGVWTHRNRSTWTQIHGFTPESAISGRLNAN